MMRRMSASFLLFTLAFFTNGQNSENAIDGFDKDKIHRAIYQAYKKAKVHDTAYYEGFFILKITNPFRTTYNRVLTSSTDNVKMFGDKLLSKLNQRTFPAIALEVREILIPVINLVKCKKHNHGSLEEFQRQIKSYFESQDLKNNDSVLILHEITITGYHK